MNDPCAVDADSCTNTDYLSPFVTLERQTDCFLCGLDVFDVKSIDTRTDTFTTSDAYLNDDNFNTRPEVSSDDKASDDESSDDKSSDDKSSDETGADDDDKAKADDDDKAKADDDDKAKADDYDKAKADDDDKA